MKQILAAFLFLFITAVSFAQDTTYSIPVNEEGMIVFKEVVQQEGTQKELFNRSINWLNNTYKNSPAVTSLRDFQTGKIIGHHRIRLYLYDDNGFKKDGPMILYTFTLEFRDGRYRWVIDDLLVRKASRYPLENWLNKDDPAYNEQWPDYLQQVAAFVDEWSVNLKEMMKPEPVEVEEEW